MAVSKRTAGLAAASLVLTGAVVAWAAAPSEDAKPEVGLFTTLPILWNESASIGETLDGTAPTHWVRTALQQDHRPVPLDTVDEENIAGLDRIMMGQPRPLSPSENVALDAWVRKGGRLLMFADPMLTGHSRFSIGDRRRPQDVVLVSPILGHWGLELQVAEEDETGESERQVFGAAIPVDLPGRLVAKGATTCSLSAGGLVAECPLGKGRATIVADAALLEDERVDQAPAFASIVARAFSD